MKPLGTTDGRFSVFATYYIALATYSLKPKSKGVLVINTYHVPQIAEIIADIVKSSVQVCSLKRNR